jgi:hypothetical protein
MVALDVTDEFTKLLATRVTAWGLATAGGAVYIPVTVETGVSDVISQVEVDVETVRVPIGGITDHVTPGTFVPRTVAWKDVDPPADRDAE